MKTIRISTKQAEEFFRNEVLFEESRIDGYTLEDMVTILTGEEYKYVSSQLDGIIIAVTAYKKDSKGPSAEVHTFVLPEHRKHSIEALKSHVEYFKREKINYLFTTCSNHNKKVINFLTKRLGFTIYEVFGVPNTKDGKPVTLYDLMKVVV